MKARNGVWTPWARVLCVECDYTALKDNPRVGESYDRHLKAVAAMQRTEEVERSEGAMIATCDTCSCKCWVRDDVALLQQVGFKSSDLDWEGPFGWALQQTGGMCCALVFETEGRQIVVTAMDGAFYVGEYVHADGEEESWEHPIRTWESTPLYGDDGEMKGADALEGMVEECTRKAIEIIRNPSTETSA